MKKRIQKIIIYSYILMFIFLGLGIAGNIELNLPVPKWSIILFVFNGISVYQVNKNGGYK